MRYWRLLKKAEEQGETFNFLLLRYAAERLLYRLGKSQYSNQFILKGATLFTIWYGEPHRATKDLDLLGYGSNKISDIEEIFQEVCQEFYEEDGVEFFPKSVKGEQIKKEQDYQGVRLKIEGKLDTARLTVQIDIGFGDAITPEPKLVDFPAILDLPSAKLRIYPPETVVAEKFQAIVALDITNSRLKDFYDIWFLAQKIEFQGDLLCKAIKATFERRETHLPTITPLGLTAEFAEDSGKQAQWRGFINKGKLKSNSATLSDIVSVLESFLMPPCLASSGNTHFDFKWIPQKQQWLGKSVEEEVSESVGTRS